jgi:hypothetical protein
LKTPTPYPEAVPIIDIKLITAVDAMASLTNDMTNDISAYILQCADCDHEWRSQTPQRCPNCARHMGAALTLQEDQIKALMEAVETQCVGVNDETDLMFVLSEMMSDSWPDVPADMLAQACWMHLRNSDEETDEGIDLAMQYFEARFMEA